MRARKGFSPGIRRSGSPSNNREPPARHSRVRFERFQWLAAPFPSHSCPGGRRLGRASPVGKAAAQLVSNSKKQYQIPAGLARNCRAFLIGRPGPRPDAFATPRGSAEEAPQPNPVSQSPCLKVLQEGPDRCLLFIVHRAGIEVHEKEL